MNDGSPILITGFMGAGKTTVATMLAQHLECRMIDLDQLIVEREGRTIARIIDEDGEAHFRERETSALLTALHNDTAAQQCCIIALGGGAWTIERNRRLIAEHNGRTVWLDVPFTQCWQRISRAAGGGADAPVVRPLARDPEQARKLYRERRKLYCLAALHIKINKGRTSADTVKEIAQALSSQQPLEGITAAEAE